MSSNFNQFIFLLLLLISCGGSKSDVNDPVYNNSNNSTNNQNNNSNSNTNTNQTYTFNNDLVWADEFDEDSSFGNPPVSADNWNIETVAPDNGCLLYTSDAADE